MDARIYFSHGMVFVYDSAEAAPGNDWTDEHSLQGFARRPTTANVATLIEFGCAHVHFGSHEELEKCDRVVAVSVCSESGAIAMSGVDPEDHVVWRGRPGWVRVSIGQTSNPDSRELRLIFVAEEAARDEPSAVREHGDWLRREFVESADTATY